MGDMSLLRSFVMTQWDIPWVITGLCLLLTIIIIIGLRILSQKEDKKETCRKENILWFEEVSLRDVNSVGGKGANLGECTAAGTIKTMLDPNPDPNPVSSGLPVPPGFCITSIAYRNAVETLDLGSYGIAEAHAAILKRGIPQEVRN